MKISKRKKLLILGIIISLISIIITIIESNFNIINGLKKYLIQIIYIILGIPILSTNISIIIGYILIILGCLKIKNNKKILTLGLILSNTILIYSLIKNKFSFLDASKYYFEILKTAFEKTIMIIKLLPNNILIFLTILGIILIIIGLFTNNNYEEIKENQEKIIKKYKLLKKIGYSPFVIVLSIVIYSMIFGTSNFFGNKIYGFEALYFTLMIISFIVWPLYIIGIFLIIKSNKTLKQITYESKEKKTNK